MKSKWFHNCSSQFFSGFILKKRKKSSVFFSSKSSGTAAPWALQELYIIAALKCLVQNLCSLLYEYTTLYNCRTSANVFGYNFINYVALTFYSIVRRSARCSSTSSTAAAAAVRPVK